MLLVFIQSDLKANQKSGTLKCTRRSKGYDTIAGRSCFVPRTMHGMAFRSRLPSDLRDTTPTLLLWPMEGLVQALLRYAVVGHRRVPAFVSDRVTGRGDREVWALMGSAGGSCAHVPTIATKVRGRACMIMAEHLKSVVVEATPLLTVHC